MGSSIFGSEGDKMKTFAIRLNEGPEGFFCGESLTPKTIADAVIFSKKESGEDMLEFLECGEIVTVEICEPIKEQKQESINRIEKWDQNRYE